MGEHLALGDLDPLLLGQRAPALGRQLVRARCEPWNAFCHPGEQRVEPQRLRQVAGQLAVERVGVGAEEAFTGAGELRVEYGHGRLLGLAARGTCRQRIAKDLAGAEVGAEGTSVVVERPADRIRGAKRRPRRQLGLTEPASEQPIDRVRRGHPPNPIPRRVRSACPAGVDRLVRVV